MLKVTENNKLVLFRGGDKSLVFIKGFSNTFMSYRKSVTIMALIIFYLTTIYTLYFVDLKKYLVVEDNFFILWGKESELLHTVFELLSLDHSAIYIAVVSLFLLVTLIIIFVSLFKFFKRSSFLSIGSFCTKALWNVFSTKKVIITLPFIIGKSSEWILPEINFAFTDTTMLLGVTCATAFGSYILWKIWSLSRNIEALQHDIAKNSTLQERTSNYLSDTVNNTIEPLANEAKKQALSMKTLNEALIRNNENNLGINTQQAEFNDWQTSVMAHLNKTEERLNKLEGTSNNNTEVIKRVQENLKLTESDISALSQTTDNIFVTFKQILIDEDYEKATKLTQIGFNKWCDYKDKRRIKLEE